MSNAFQEALSAAKKKAFRKCYIHVVRACYDLHHSFLCEDEVSESHSDDELWKWWHNLPLDLRTSLAAFL